MAPTDSKNKGLETTAGGLVEVSSGQYVLKEGERGSEMYIIEKGQVEILKQAGGAERRLLLLERGDFFGEESVAAKMPRVASARAVSDCRLLALDAAALREMLDQGADVGLKLVLGLSQRFREALRLVPAGTLETRKVAPDEVAKPKIESAEGSDKLVHSPSGMEFEIPELQEIMIGRHDAVSGTDPDIDLSSLDREHSLSRHHAELFRREGKLFVSDEAGSANGTFVNDKRVEKGSPVELKDGDKLRFGLIETCFRAAG